MKKKEGGSGLTDFAAADELAIRDLVSAYANAVNRKDGSAWSATWADTGEWHIGGRHLVGRADILEFWTGAMGAFEAVIQMLSHGSVTAAGDDRAEGQWTIFEVGRRDGKGSLVVGCYQDRYVRETTGWAFADRRFTA